MKRYNLINRQTGQETICNKVVVDGWDYYYNDDEFGEEYYYDTKQETIRFGSNNHITGGYKKKVIATTNLSIDLPKVVDEVEKFENEYFKNISWGSVNPRGHYEALRAGYNKSQETHPFSEEDMIEFLNWIGEDDYRFEKWATNKISPKELLQLWKEQKPKIVYYESI